MPKKAAPVELRAAIAQRLQHIIREGYGTLYQFGKEHPTLLGRVATWLAPQSKRRPSKADLDALKTPDLASFLEFSNAVGGVSLDWLLRGDGEPFPLSDYVQREISARTGVPVTIDGAALLRRLIDVGVTEARTLNKWWEDVSFLTAVSEARKYAASQPDGAGVSGTFLRGSAITGHLEQSLIPAKPSTVVIDSV